MEEKFLKLTNAVYKLLEFFPESDPLKNRTKDKALLIMENLVLVNGTDGWASLKTCLPAGREKVKIQLIEDIDILLGYILIAKSQGWLSAINCLIISNEYEKIKKQIEPIAEPTQKLPGILEKRVAAGRPDLPLGPKDTPVTPRQGKIVEFLVKNEKAQVMDLQAILPDVTKRTIRRDLDELLESGKIVRLGEFNQVVYKIK